MRIWYGKQTTWNPKKEKNTWVELILICVMSRYIWLTEKSHYADWLVGGNVAMIINGEAYSVKFN